MAIGCNKTVSFNLTTPESFTARDILTGAGYLKSTVMHYGHYSNVIFSLGYPKVYYNIPLAYLLAVGFTLLIMLIIMSQSLAKSHKKYYIEQRGLTRNVIFNKVFCGWDFAITNVEAARLQSSSLHQELKELASPQKTTGLSTIGQKFVKTSRIVIFNLIAVAVLGGIGYAIYYLLYRNFLVTDIDVIKELTVPLTISAFTIILPALFEFMVLFEGYESYKTKVRITLLRCMMMIVVLVVVPIYFHLRRKTDQVSSPEVEKCAETELGSELYRFLLVDFVVWILLYFPAFWLKSLVYKCGLTFFNMEFNVAWHTWNLLYNQVLCWIGMLFSPLFPVIVIIKLVINFYLKKMTVLWHCQPPSKVLRAQRIQTTFLTMTFLLLVFCIVLVGYFVINVKPSDSCGPFRGLDFPYEIVMCVTSVFRGEDSEDWALAVELITKPGCVALIVIFLCCLAYYSRSVALARMKMMQLLQEQVILEGKDKVFLVRMYDVALRNWHHNRSAEGIGDSASNTTPSRGPRGSVTTITTSHHGMPPVDSASPAVRQANNGHVSFAGDRMSIDENNARPSREDYPFSNGEGSDNRRFAQDSPQDGRFRQPPSKWRYQGAMQQNPPFPGIVQHQPPLQHLGTTPNLETRQLRKDSVSLEESKRGKNKQKRKK